MEPKTVVTTALRDPDLWVGLPVEMEFGNLSAATQISEGHIST